MAAERNNHTLDAATIRVPHHVVYRDFVSETVVLNLQTGCYHGLNPTAGRMLTVLDQVGSLQEAAALLAIAMSINVCKRRGTLIEY